MVVGKDVAIALGYKETANMRKLLDISEYREIDPQSVDFAGFVQNGEILEPNKNIRRMLLINESGLYQAIFSSTLKKAKEFKHWVTSEVLPSIRKTGQYKIKPKSDLEVLAQGFEILMKLKEKHEKIIQEQQLTITQKEDEIKQKDNKIAADKPKVIFADAVEASKNSILIGQLAKLLKQNGINIGQNRLFEVLREDGFLIKSGNRKNTPTQKAMDLKLFTIKENVISNLTGIITSLTTKVTGKGQTYFINYFLNKSQVSS